MAANPAAAIDRVLYAHRSSCLDNDHEVARLRVGLVDELRKESCLADLLGSDELADESHVVEWLCPGAVTSSWFQAYLEDDVILQRSWDGTAWVNQDGVSFFAHEMRRRARLVPIDLALADPDTRGAIEEG